MKTATKELTSDELMRELDEILSEDSADYDRKRKVREVKRQIKAREIYGLDSSRAGYIIARRLDFVTNRILFDVEEAVIDTTVEGVNKHTGVYIEASTPEAMTTINRGIATYQTIIVWRKSSKQVLAVIDRDGEE